MHRHHLTHLALGWGLLLGTSIPSSGQQTLKPIFRPYPIQITSTLPATLVAEKPLAINFTVTNTGAQPASGDVIPQLSGVTIAPTYTHISRLAPGAVFTGTVTIQAPPVCYMYQLELDFVRIDTLGAHQEISKATHKPVTVWATTQTQESAAIQNLGFATVTVDNDFDGMDDVVEDHLLEKFRPLMRYSIDDGPETYAPTDPFLYIEGATIGGDYPAGSKNTDNCPVIPGFDQTQLATNPAALLNVIDAATGGSADVLQTKTKLKFHLAPNHTAEHGGPFPGRGHSTNRGLFGHVVPVILWEPSGYERNQQYPCTGFELARLYYKVEFWQFYGFNYAHHQQIITDIADHQGDWCTLQLIIEPGTERIVTALYYAHGYEMRFDVMPSMVPTTFFESGVPFQQYTGKNGDIQPTTDIAQGDGGCYKKDQTFLRLAKDPLTDSFTHPVVFIENGSHEFWPSEFGRVGQSLVGISAGPASAGATFYSPLHNGDDLEDSYLADTPPNLGEVGHALLETVEANVIMRYNGFWGCYNNYDLPPPGPAMHTEWTHPAADALFPLLQAAGVLEN